MSRLRSLLRQVNWLDEKPSLQSGSNSDPSQVTAPALRDLATDRVTLTPETRLVYHTDPHGAAADRYRLLRIRLQTARNLGKLRKLLVTSPLPGDGKSTVVMNLATALAEKGNRTVLVVDADLHQSPLARSLGVRAQPGLAECLADGSDPLTAIRYLEPLNWYVLPAGKATTNPAELLHGSLLPNVLETLANNFDWLLIDSPPVIPLSEVLTLKEHSDGSLLVVRAGLTSQDAVEEAITLLGKQHVLGIVLNGVEQSDMIHHKYGYDRYSGYSGSSSLNQ
jgi:capsular exopolysaccharide synthesis family protein